MPLTSEGTTDNHDPVEQARVVPCLYLLDIGVMRASSSSLWSSDLISQKGLPPILHLSKVVHIDLSVGIAENIVVYGRCSGVGGGVMAIGSDSEIR